MHRIVSAFNFIAQIDWRAMVAFIAAAIAMPFDTFHWDWLIRLTFPIIGGAIWVFLKPLVVRYRNKKIKK